MTDTTPTIRWELATSYELFMSLHVLHMPEYYGIRASWAAGIRSRIPAVERKFLEEVLPFMGFPIGWAYNLPAPKDAISALWALKQIPAAERMLALFECGEEATSQESCNKVLLDIARRGSWDEKDLKTYSAELMENKWKHNEAAVKTYLDWWTRLEEFGEKFLNALQAYHQAFFEDEEKRVLPVLQAGLKNAQEAAQNISLTELIPLLSKGIHYDEIKNFKEVVIAPAYWTTPLIVLEKLNDDQILLLFGARPDTMSAIPGELVPDSLLRTLKALADPTRLKILHYLTQGEVTPSELARRLNLRAPTVTHHLSELRFSGLVNVTYRGQEKLYTSRLEALDTTCENLRDFLQNAPKDI